MGCRVVVIPLWSGGRKRANSLAATREKRGGLLLLGCHQHRTMHIKETRLDDNNHPDGREVSLTMRGSLPTIPRSVDKTSPATRQWKEQSVFPFHKTTCSPFLPSMELVGRNCLLATN